jgi:hypothetical protein
MSEFKDKFMSLLFEGRIRRFLIKQGLNRFADKKTADIMRKNDPNVKKRDINLANRIRKEYGPEAVRHTLKSAPDVARKAIDTFKSEKAAQRRQELAKVGVKAAGVGAGVGAGVTVAKKILAKRRNPCSGLSGEALERCQSKYEQ